MPGPYYGPWINPGEVDNPQGIVGFDGVTILSRGLPMITETFNPGGVEEEAHQIAFFTGEPTTGQLTDVDQALAGGATINRGQYTSISSGGGTLINEAWIGSPHLGQEEAAQRIISSFHLPQIPGAAPWYPPEYYTDPHVIGINFRGSPIITHTYYSVLSWYQDANGNSYTHVGGGAVTLPSPDGLAVMVGELGNSAEGTAYDYSASPPPWFVTTGPQGSVRGLFTPPGPADGHNMTSGWPTTFDDPQIEVFELTVAGVSGDASVLLDSHGCFPVALYFNSRASRMSDVWPWVIIPQNPRQETEYALQTIVKGGLRYIPMDYQLIYDHPVSGWGVDYVRMAAI